jgi:chromosome segregation ATPase
LARFREIAEAVCPALGIEADFFDPADVLKGKEVAKTLRLLQLLAVAAARYQPQPSHGGLTRPRELPTILNLMDRCLQGAKHEVELRHNMAAGTSDGDRSLEEKIHEAERQLQAEARARVRQEEALADAERQLQESNAQVRRVEIECELTASNEAGADPEQDALQRQVVQLEDHANAEAAEGDILRMLLSQLEEVRNELSQDEIDASALDEKRQELEASLAAAEAQAQQLEAEVQRERERHEAEQELMGQTPEEQKLILQAHERKLRMRAEALEAQFTQIQAEADERKASNLRLGHEQKELISKAEDATLQIQIVQEERDALREAMEQLFSEKAKVEEELKNIEDGYNNLTERLNLKQDEACELEHLVEQKKMEVAGLQKEGWHMLCGTAGPVPVVAA